MSRDIRSMRDEIKAPKRLVEAAKQGERIAPISPNRSDTTRTHLRRFSKVFVIYACIALLLFSIPMLSVLLQSNFGASPTNTTVRPTDSAPAPTTPERNTTTTRTPTTTPELYHPPIPSPETPMAGEEVESYMNSHTLLNDKIDRDSYFSCSIAYFADGGMANLFDDIFTAEEWQKAEQEGRFEAATYTDRVDTNGDGVIGYNEKTGETDRWVALGKMYFIGPTGSFFWSMTEAVTLDSYVIYTANDSAVGDSRNPIGWKLYATNDDALAAKPADAIPYTGTSVSALKQVSEFEEAGWVCIDDVYNGNMEETNFTPFGYKIDEANQKPYKHYCWFIDYGGETRYISTAGMKLFAAEDSNENGEGGEVPVPPTTDPPPTTTPEPTPTLGNPEQYGFTTLPYNEPEKWFYFEEGHHWTYMYTTQTNIGDTLDRSLLKASEYDEATDSYIPSADAYENGWRQQNNEYASYLTPVSGMSAVIAFRAPEDGCYLFEFSFCAGMQADTDSDGVTFSLFGDDRLVYSFHSTQVEIDGEIETAFISLRKGECAYFVADPLSSGNGDICESVILQVTRQADIYIDNEDTFGFGYVYNNGSSEQGTNGWYACYANDPPISIRGLIPYHIIAHGNIFGMIADGDANDPENDAVISWVADEDGEYTVSVRLWSLRDDTPVSFYCGDELITTCSDINFGTYQMTCTLKKGECFAIIFEHSEMPAEDMIDELQILIERN